MLFERGEVGLRQANAELDDVPRGRGAQRGEPARHTHCLLHLMGALRGCGSRKHT